ncbi:MAG: hypothetical protein QW356_05115 [Candidatus Hadarchaeales archaeon]
MWLLPRKGRPFRSGSLRDGRDLPRPNPGRIPAQEAEGKGRPLLADSAYDYTLAYGVARERGFRPVIKPRESKEGPHGLERREMVESFDPELYRLRKVAEGFFGAIATRYLSRVRYRLLHVQECSILLMGVGQNLRILLRLMSEQNMG